MTTKIEDYDWIFDKWRWAETLKALSDDDRQAAIQLSGLTKSGWYHWLNPDKSQVYIHPGMLHFLQVCDMLRLDPREFFCLDVEDK